MVTQLVAHTQRQNGQPLSMSMMSVLFCSRRDCENWLVASKDAVIGEYYANTPREIMRSSTSSEPYTARWLNRASQLEDPWISLSDGAISVPDGTVLYAENHYPIHRATAGSPLLLHNGGNVFVKL